MKKILIPVFFLVILVIGIFAYISLSNLNRVMESEAGEPADVQEANDFYKPFNSRLLPGSFVLFDLKRGKISCFNPDEAQRGYLPASTFKIPHTLIALNEGVVKGREDIFKWDGRHHPVKAWNQDQTLVTAITYSCVWVYVHIAEKMGLTTYQKYLKGFDYGNQDLSGPPAWFWLEGPFKISAFQQVEFLKKLYLYQLPVSKSSIDTVKDLIVLKKTKDYTLFGKTGGTRISDAWYIMWLVGFLEKGDQTFIYAMNFKTDNFAEDKDHRLGIVTDIFKGMGLI